MSDVVAKLDRAIANPFGWHTATMQRARDEIVRLRKLTDGDWVWKQITDTRAEALEEAARKAEHYEAPIWSVIIAQAIRALKQKH